MVVHPFLFESGQEIKNQVQKEIGGTLLDWVPLKEGVTYFLFQ